MLMVIDNVEVVTTPKQCFCEVVAALLQFLLSVDIIDMVFTANRLRDSVPSWNYCWLEVLLAAFYLC